MDYSRTYPLNHKEPQCEHRRQMYVRCIFTWVCFLIKCLTGFWNSGCDGLHSLNLTELCGDFTGLLWKTWAGQNSEIQWATWTVSWNKKTIVFPFPVRVFFLWDCSILWPSICGTVFHSKKDVMHCWPMLRLHLGKNVLISLTLSLFIV